MPQDFHPVPDWFSWENQGAGVAVAEIGGRQQLVVMMVDDGPQQNRGLYRIGHGLTAGGVTGWTPWIDVPDWFPWANQGADVAVTDLGGGPAMVVLMIDDGPQVNRGLYRIGTGLTADGAVTGWTPWIDVPGWFSWRNQGAGVAVTGPDQQGRRDLVVFMIDDGDKVNSGQYKIGRNLRPTAPWTAGRTGSTSRAGSPGSTRAAGSPSPTSTATAAGTSSCSRSTTPSPHRRPAARTRASSGSGAGSGPTGRYATGDRTGSASRTGSRGPTRAAASRWPRSTASRGSSRS